MAGTNKIQKVRILDVEIEADNIIAEFCEDDKMKALMKPTMDLLIIRLKERAK